MGGRAAEEIAVGEISTGAQNDLLRATELAVVDDPTIKQRGVAAKAGSYSGTKKYGDAANLPARLDKAAQGKPSGKFGRKSASAGATGSKIHKPSLDEMGIASWHEVKPDRKDVARPRKPTLDEVFLALTGQALDEPGDAAGHTAA